MECGPTGIYAGIVLQIAFSTAVNTFYFTSDGDY